MVRISIIILFVIVFFSCEENIPKKKNQVNFGTHTSSRGVLGCLESFGNADSLINRKEIKLVLSDSIFKDLPKKVFYFKEFMFDKYNIEVLYRNVDDLRKMNRHKLINNESIKSICFKERMDLFLLKKYGSKKDSYFINDFESSFSSLDSLDMVKDLKGYNIVTSNKADRHPLLSITNPIKKNLIDFNHERTGTLKLRIYINEKGETDSIIVKSSYSNEIDKYLINYLEAFKWQIGYQDTKPVSYRRNLFIDFENGELIRIE